MLKDPNMEQENQETKEELKHELERVNTEIGNYPSPITGCDEQFNYLLEKRSEMERRIKELSEKSEKIKMWEGGNLY